MDMTSLKETVSSHLPILPVLQIWDVHLGIGRVKNVLPALIDGHSTNLIFVCLLLINVLQVIMLVCVLHAIKDMILRMDNVSILCPMMPSLLISAAVHGIGTTKSV